MCPPNISLYEREKYARAAMWAFIDTIPAKYTYQYDLTSDRPAKLQMYVLDYFNRDRRQDQTKTTVYFIYSTVIAEKIYSPTITSPREDEQRYFPSPPRLP